MNQRKSGPEPSAKAAEPPINAARYLGAGLSWVVTTAVFAYAGYWADGKLGSKPWLTLAGAFIGAAAGFYSLLRQIAPNATKTRKNTKE